MLRHRDLKTKEPGVLGVAVYPHFFPVAYRNASGEFDGLDVAIMRAFASAAGLRLRLIPVETFDGIWNHPSNDDSPADVAIGGIANSIGRGGADTEWSMPYFYVHRSVVYRKSDPITAFPKTHDQVLGTVGSTGWVDARTRMTGMGLDLSKMVSGTSDEEDLQRLLDGDVQGLMRGDLVSKAIVAAHPRELAYSAWNIVPTLVPSDGEVFAFPCKLGSGVAVSLTTFLVESMMNGSLDALAEQFKLDGSSPALLDHENVTHLARPVPPLPSAEVRAADAARVRAFMASPEKVGSVKDFLDKYLRDTHRDPTVVGSEIAATEQVETYLGRLSAQLQNMSVPDAELILAIGADVRDILAISLEGHPRLNGGIRSPQLQSCRAIRFAAVNNAQAPVVAYDRSSHTVVFNVAKVVSDFTRILEPRARQRTMGKYMHWVLRLSTAGVLAACADLWGMPDLAHQLDFCDGCVSLPMPPNY